MTQPDPRPARSLAELETELSLLIDDVDDRAHRFNCSGKYNHEQLLADLEASKSHAASLLREAAQAQEPGGVEELEWKPADTSSMRAFRAEATWDEELPRQVSAVVWEYCDIPGEWFGYWTYSCTGHTISSDELNDQDPESLKKRLEASLHHLRRALG